MGSTQATGRENLKSDRSKGDTGDVLRSQITFTTANPSLYAILQMKGGAGAARSVRVLEINLQKNLGIHDGTQADEFIEHLRQNYGWLGRNFMRVVVKNRDKVHKRIRDKMTELRALSSSGSHERFWVSAAACALVAGEIAVRMGMVTWDMPAIQKWFLEEQLPEMRETVLEELVAHSEENQLTTYLEQIHPNLIQTTSPPGGNMGAHAIFKPNGAILGHWDKDRGLIYVLKEPFRHWCEKRAYYSAAILRELQKKGVVPHTSVTRTLGKGTDMAKAKAHCFIVNLDHKLIAGVKPKLVASNANSHTPAATR